MGAEELANRASLDGIAGKMREGFGGLFSRAGEGAERLRETARSLTRVPLLQQAAEAQERGNLEAAFWLLREAFAEGGGEPGVAVAQGVAVAYWDLSMSLDRADAALDAAVALVEHHAGAREIDLAIQYWDELLAHVPDAFVNPTAVARMLPELTAAAERLRSDPAPTTDEEAEAVSQKRDRILLLTRKALGGTLHPNNEPLTAGLALRLAEDGREVDLDVARKIANVALASPELHEAKRERLTAWATDAPPASPERPAPETQPEPEEPAEPEEPKADEPPPLVLSEDEIAAAAARLRERQAAERSARKSHSTEDTDEVPGGPAEVLEAFPLALEDDALVLRMGERRQTRVPYARIEALAAAEISRDDKPPIVVIDLALNWARRDHEPLRLVRLRTNTFDPKSLVRDCPAEEALACLLAELLERSHAVPLPDPESALGLRLARFGCIEEYEARALGLH